MYSNIKPVSFLRTGCWTTFAILAALVAFYVPFNMDEAGIFHVLACNEYPFAHDNIFREACTARCDLLTPLGFTLTRPEFYTGIFHTLLFAPFFYLIHAPWAQLVFGFVFLFAFAFMLSRQTSNPKLSFPLFLAFFPFVFQFTHDMGPVKFALLAFPLAAFLVQKIIATANKGRYIFAALLAFLIVAATEEKPFFLYLLPSLAFFCLAMLPREFLSFKKGLRERALVLLFTLALTACGLFCLLFARNQQGDYYIAWLVQLAGNKSSLADWLGNLTAFLFYWPYYAHNSFTLDPTSLAAIGFSLFSAMFMIVLGVMTFKASPAERTKIFLLIASSVAGALIFAYVGNTWAGHHFIFLWVPLIVLIADRLAVLQLKARFWFVLVFLLLNLASIPLVMQAPIPAKTSRDRDVILAYFNEPERAAHAIVNAVSWGYYYTQALYGPKSQLVTYTEPFEPEEIRVTPITAEWAKGLLALSAQTGRTLYNVCRDPLCNKDALEMAFLHRVAFVEIPLGLHDWHVFKATPHD